MTTKEYLTIYRKCPFYSEPYEGQEEDKNSIIEFNKELCDKYHWLTPRNRWTGEVAEDFDYSFTELDDLPDGWRIAFGDQLCEELNNELKKFDFEDEYSIVQIKEKYGSLRWYDSGYPIGKLADKVKIIKKVKWGYPKHKDDEYVRFVSKDEDDKFVFEKRKILEKCKITDIIHKYEDLSKTTCINCGKPATKISVGWISPWCDVCSEEIHDMLVPVDEYFNR